MTERRSIVYLLLCFGFPNEFFELFRILYNSTDHFVIHCDAKSPAALRGLVRQLAASFPNVHCIEPRLCSWAGYSLVDATLRGIDHALEKFPQWSHLAVLSEQHLPLRSPDEIAAALRPGVSRFDVERVATMDAERRDLIAQRFAYTFRELPGVGCFALRRADQLGSFLDQLYHGSQWITLAREACERLRGRDGFPDIMARMQASFIADETCIQTLLGGTRLGAGIKVQVMNATYVAWPALNGRYDLIFTDENFVSAREKKYLFIRKRPPVLPSAVKQVVEPFAGLTAAEFDARLVRYEAPPSEATIDLQRLATGFSAGLVAHRPDLEILPPYVGNAWTPRFFLRLRTPPMHPDVCMTVLSEDLRHFKVLLVWRRPGPRVHLPIAAAGYPTLLLEVRVGTITHQREIHLPSSADQGFVTLQHAGDIEPLIRTATAYLAIADGIQFQAGRDF
jgi:hypothetical protein